MKNKVRWLPIAGAALLLAALAVLVVVWRRSSSSAPGGAAHPPCAVQCERFPSVPADACVRTCERLRVERPTLDFSTNYGQCTFDCLMTFAAVIEVRDAQTADAEASDAQPGDAGPTPNVQAEQHVIAACADRCIEMRARPHPPAAPPSAPPSAPSTTPSGQP